MLLGDDGRICDRAMIGAKAHGQHARAVALLGGEFLHGRAQAVTCGGENDHLMARFGHARGHDLIAGRQLHGQYARGGQPHHPHILLRKSDALAHAGDEHDVVVTIAQHRGQQRISLLQLHHHGRGVSCVPQVIQADALATALLADQENALFVIAIALRPGQGDHGHDLVILAQAGDVAEGLSLLSGDLVHRFLHHLARGGEEEKGVLGRGRGHEQGRVRAAPGQ